MFFVFRTESLYDQPFGSVVETLENRFYVDNSRLLRWLDPQKRSVSPDAPAYAEQQTRITGLSRRLLAIAQQ